VALDLFGQMASFQLEIRLAAAALADRLGRKSIQDTVIAHLAGEPDIAAGFQRLAERLIDYVPATGMALVVDGVFNSIGQAPPEAEVRRFVDWLNSSVTEGVFHTNRLVDHYPAAAAFAGMGSGVLALSVSRNPRDYLIWFRPELRQVVRWAGNPNKPVLPGDGRLSPRKSFDDWLQQVEQQSEPWSLIDIHTAEALRVSLLEVVLTHVDQLARERERARIQQEALLVELDNRIIQWEQTAGQLKEESDRRAVLEAELSQVLRRTVVDQESERQRIARELHDSLGQYLTAMQLDLTGIAHDKSVSQSIRKRIDRLKTLTADAGQEVNHLAWEIRPTALDDMGLQRAVEQFVEEWSERAPLQFDVHLTLNDRRLSPAVESTLYRVTQEAVRNIINHAGAERAGVILEASESEVRLIVEDNGKGFVLDDEGGGRPSPGLGLLGMRERLALIGGSLEIESAPGRGTTLIIHVPL
jgi:signal transduction histidine kinase